MKKCLVCSHVNPSSATICSHCQAPLDAPGQATARITKTTIRTFDAHSLIEGDVIGKRYKIIKQLGQGGMGTVYLVEDLELNNERCALKLIHPELINNPEARERFKTEVTTSRQLHHHGIVRVFDLGRDDKVYYFTMEYLKGESLADKLQERRGQVPPFTPAEIKPIMSGILKALAYAHKTTIHRDIKPDNIVLTGEFPDVSVKILDFGIARTMSLSRFTQTAQGLGTPYYMAPEQLQNAHAIDKRADLYGVGMILYELLTGAQAIGRFQLPSEILGAAWQPFDDLIIKSLAPAPEQRYSDAEEMLRRFDRAMEEITANPDQDMATSNLVEKIPDKKQIKKTTPREPAGAGQPPGKRTTKNFPPAWLIGGFLAVIAVILLVVMSSKSPEQPPQPVPPAPKTGRLTVTTTPSDAHIYFIGTDKIYAPGMSLEQGSYTLRIEKEGYENIVQPVVINENEHQRLALNLERKILPGRLTVQTTPSDAHIIIRDGPEYYPGMELDPGSYSIEITRDGYYPMVRTVTINEDQSIREHFNLERISKKTKYRVGWLRVEPTPSWATVKVLHIKPIYHDDMALKPGKYEIEVSAEGYKTEYHRLTVKKDQPLICRVKLRRQRVRQRPSTNNPPWPVPPEPVINVLPRGLQQFFGK